MTRPERLDPTVDHGLPDCWLGAARQAPAPPELAEGRHGWNWSELDDAEARGVWLTLFDFVAYFNARYGARDEHRIPPCWALHGALVEEITTLCWTRHEAFVVAGSPSEAQAWHHRSLPGFLDRLGRWLGEGQRECQIGAHVGEPLHEATDGDDWLARAADIAEMESNLREAHHHRSDLGPAS